MSALLELAERCEKATGDDALELINLECDICAALGMETGRHETPFTASVDAAMTLVPEGHVMAVTNCGTDSPRGPDWTKASAVVGKEEDHATEPVTAATPALALCAASLKARAHAGEPA